MSSMLSLQHVTYTAAFSGVARKSSTRSRTRTLTTPRAMTTVTSEGLPSGCSFTYFDIPALGEPARLLLQLGGEPWTDTRPSFADWGAMKPTTKWGQLPFLKLQDGTEMTQSLPIVHFLASKIAVGGGSKMYPGDDAMAAYKIDEMIAAFEDLRPKVAATFNIKDKEEKEAARAALFEPDGAGTAIMLKIEAQCAGAGRVVATADGAFTVADLWAFWFLNFLRSGFWEGLPSDYLNAATYPKLVEIVDAFGSIPAVRAYYTEAAEKNKMYAVFAATELVSA